MKHYITAEIQQQFINVSRREHATEHSPTLGIRKMRRKSELEILSDAVISPDTRISGTGYERSTPSS